VLLDLYAAWVRQIEVGCATWSDRQTELEAIILNKRFVESAKKSITNVSQKYSRSVLDDSKVWYCALYQADKCKDSPPHDQFIKDVGIKKVSHICASCLNKDGNKLFHSPKSQDCPHKDNKDD
jgi:hypothetical protein